MNCLSVPTRKNLVNLPIVPKCYTIVTGTGILAVNLSATEIAGLMIRAYEHHWFQLTRPAIKPVFEIGGLLLRGPRLTRFPSFALRMCFPFNQISFEVDWQR